MKVLVVGGYGVFGERLARLLLRDGHQVTVAGRDLAKAKALAAQLGCSAQQVDRKGDLAALVVRMWWSMRQAPSRCRARIPGDWFARRSVSGCITLTCQTARISAQEYR